MVCGFLNGVHEFEGNTETFTYEMLLDRLEVRVKKILTKEC